MIYFIGTSHVFYFILSSSSQFNSLSFSSFLCSFPSILLVNHTSSIIFNHLPVLFITSLVAASSVHLSVSSAIHLVLAVGLFLHLTCSSFCQRCLVIRSYFRTCFRPSGLHSASSLRLIFHPLVPSLSLMACRSDPCSGRGWDGQSRCPTYPRLLQGTEPPPEH